MVNGRMAFFLSWQPILESWEMLQIYPATCPEKLQSRGGEYSQFWRVSTFYVLSFKHGLLILADWNFECSTTSFGIGKIVFVEVGFAVKTSHSNNGINNGINHRLTNFCKLRH